MNRWDNRLYIAGEVMRRERSGVGGKEKAVVYKPNPVLWAVGACAGRCRAAGFAVVEGWSEKDPPIPYLSSRSGNRPGNRSGNTLPYTRCLSIPTNTCLPACQYCPDCLYLTAYT